MGQYIAKRLLLVVPTLLGVTLITFLIIHLIPGDPVWLMLGTDATPEAVQEMHQELGLDKPLPVQYIRWLKGVLKGDLGRSIWTYQSVTSTLRERFGPTVLLTSTALLISAVFGITAGVIASVKPYQLPDQISILISLIGVSMPAYWLGVVLILVFSIWFGVLPPVGMSSPTGGFSLKYLILPALTLAMRCVAMITRLTRGTMLEVLSQDYIRTAHSKGLLPRIVLVRHALRNAMIPVITYIGVLMGALLGGAVLVETVFAWPGLGRLVVIAILSRDYPLVQGSLLLIAVIFVFINLVVDLTYGLIDPRVQYS